MIVYVEQLRCPTFSVAQRILISYNLFMPDEDVFNILVLHMRLVLEISNLIKPQFAISKIIKPQNLRAPLNAEFE